MQVSAIQIYPNNKLEKISYVDYIVIRQFKAVWSDSKTLHRALVLQQQKYCSVRPSTLHILARL